MTRKHEVKSIKQKANGQNFYCEVRGSGPTVVFIPSGEGDCGSFDKVADALADEFTIFSLDMRGCSRTGRPSAWTPITPEILADDVAGLIKALNLAPATVYGCSSGGQTCLSLGVYHPKLIRNIIVHEAALLCDSPLSGPDLPECGEATRNLKAAVNQFVQMAGSKDAAMDSLMSLFVGNDEAWKALGPEYHERISKNGEVWIDLYLVPVSRRSYTAKELAQMPPVVFSAGTNSPAWLVEANRRTAERGKADLVWFPSMHFPHVSHPDLFIEHIRKYTRKYI